MALAVTDRRTLWSNLVESGKTFETLSLVSIPTLCSKPSL